MFAKTSSGKKTIGTDTLIGQATTVEGKLVCETDLRIEGTITGDVHCSQNVIIGESGKAYSNIHASSLIIAGLMQGDVSVTETVIIESSGRLEGNILCRSFIIKEGGTFNGNSQMQQDTTAVANNSTSTDIITSDL
ncbi:polymer-forming cytoskeletal protein [Paenibacillus alvei]|uniref:bactofilin family protein n=1 Tax=Paenibacillus alvei TaxID=44250 RepID=UPI0013DBE782|nr:polymer-forming cytoskeletal protein [Paenibacillus alvei]NEZ43828.1 polymer-forming cytoskeletal protein [Paenibacillus alvei]